MNAKVGEKIRKLRLDKNLTQDEVAHQLGISANALSKIERGSTDINYSRLEQIATEFGLSVTELINSGEYTFYPQLPVVSENLPVYGNQKQLSELLVEMRHLKEKLEWQEKEINYLKALVDALKRRA